MGKLLVDLLGVVKRTTTPLILSTTPTAEDGGFRIYAGGL